MVKSFTVQECEKNEDSSLPTLSKSHVLLPWGFEVSSLLSWISLSYFPSLPSESPLFSPNPSMFLDGSKRCKCNNCTNLHFTECCSDSEDQNLQCVWVATLDFQPQPWYMRPCLFADFSIHPSFHVPAFTENVLEWDSLRSNSGPTVSDLLRGTLASLHLNFLRCERDDIAGAFLATPGEVNSLVPAKP